MQDPDLRAWIALQRTPGLSAAILRQLRHYCEHPQQAWLLGDDQLDALALPATARAALRAGPDPAICRRVDRDLRLIEQLRVTPLSLSDPDYPPLLRETADPPVLLYVRGDVKLLQRPQVAVVGSRRCSPQGEENAYVFGGSLAALGVTVTSGCALGIDAAGHRGALAVPEGTSVGVLGTGIDVVYPRRNRALFEQLIERGALVSEFAPGTQPHRALFPQRNRLISGLSLGVLVVEAALQSGSLITARFALEQNRDVFAVPGSIHHAGSQGCHFLIQQGARLVTSAVDILESLETWAPVPGAARGCADVRGEVPKVSADLPDDLSAEEMRLLTTVGHDPVDFDRLLARTALPVAQLQALLTGLELKGLLMRSGARYQRLVAAD